MLDRLAAAALLALLFASPFEAQTRFPSGSPPPRSRTGHEPEAELLKRALEIDHRIHEAVTKDGVTWELHMPAGTIINPRFGWRGGLTPLGQPHSAGKKCDDHESADPDEGPCYTFGEFPKACDSHAGPDEIACYTRAGDSAIWTGHYLAAEAFRYAVTRDPEALEYAWTAVRGIKRLVDVTGNDMLARAVVFDDFPFKASIESEEQCNCPNNRTVVDGRKVLWLGRTSGDQYSGVFFGLFWAHRLIPDGELRAQIADLTRRMTLALYENRVFGGDIFHVPTPAGGCESDACKESGRTPRITDEDQYLSFFRIAAAQNFKNRDLAEAYESLRFQDADELGIEVFINTRNLDGGFDCGYFKFNRLAINIPSLVILDPTYRRWEQYYLAPWERLWNELRKEDNAFFTMLNRALRDELRFSRTVAARFTEPDVEVEEGVYEALRQAASRPLRNVCLPNEYLSENTLIEKCGDTDRFVDRDLAGPIPVYLRSSTDFLWQRSPYQLARGSNSHCGDGTIEAPGIDFILPYWMARFYRVIPSDGWAGNSIR